MVNSLSILFFFIRRIAVAESAHGTQTVAVREVFPIEKQNQRFSYNLRLAPVFLGTVFVQFIDDISVKRNWPRDTHFAS
jgi:hypothetical protein